MSEMDLRVGQEVKVVDGPFQDFIGIIKEIDSRKSKLIVRVSIFGRATPVVLEFH